MLASRISRIERRGIVLVLVLAMLGLLALIGITFATFSGQARINARNYAMSLNEPQADELFDFAMGQLIGDTADIRSAIRGHSLGRDMYGNDGNQNGYITISASTGLPLMITGVTATQNSTTSGLLYQLTTNIASNDPTFYGYYFVGWIMRVGYPGAVSGTVNQTLEIMGDSGFVPSSNANAGYRTLVVNIPTLDGSGTGTGTGATIFTTPTTLTNPTQGTVTSLPGQSLANGTSTSLQFILDGRWRHAFNGPGMTTNAVYGNFRFNGLNPSTPGMDEDYDACDLENWFMAIQSGDGQVMIPSFHRPGIVRYDPANANNAVNDWQGINPAGTFKDSAARILRPRNFDGHDAATFPDLIPNPTTGKITYDVDNDGDGITDSVWLDLGFPARRDARGQLYKPMFSFMVIGLNGRIPLNTAGNLAGSATGIPYPSAEMTTYTYGTGGDHSLHLGNTVSEIDPTYALQNAFDSTISDLQAAFTPAQLNTGPTPPIVPDNSQWDSAGIDVRLTQFRNLLTGTRPQPNPTPTNTAAYPANTDSTGSINGDDNFVLYNSGGNNVSPQLQTLYFMPNNIADPGDIAITTVSSSPYVQRTTNPVPGRWGEAQSVPGIGYANPTVGGPPLNLVQTNFDNSVRAGYSYDILDILNGTTRDAADDNYNAFDPYSLGHYGELNDLDLYDAAGALMMPIDRIRRYVTPADLNGTGSIRRYDATGASTNAGADWFGRVQYNSYYRPPGTPGSVSSGNPTSTSPVGAITYPQSGNPPANNSFYTNNEGATAGTTNYGPVNNPLNMGMATFSTPTYLPDVTNNPLHGFEFFKLPPLGTGTGITNGVISGVFTFNFSTAGGMPIQNLPEGGSATNVNTTYNYPIQFPTYSADVNSRGGLDGLNDADEMNLYQPNPLLDSPFGPSDLEWLYRQQDVDGSSLSSRLAQLAPISFTNVVDGQRRRRLFSLDSWDLNNFVWANDNPGNAFPNNSTFSSTSATDPNPLGGTPVNISNASFLSYSAIKTKANSGTAILVATPTVAQRDKKINLNFPLPVSNATNEPVRQKWINDTYQLLKSVLPPLATDTAEELAELSQFLTNLIDFRDPDCTMTHFQNPDVSIVMGSITGTTYAPTYLILNTNISTTSPPAQYMPLQQYGMEYNPVAINEALAYSFLRKTASGPTQTNRFFVELVNTLTQSAIGMLPTGAFGGVIPNPPDPSILDLSVGNWDMVITADDPVSRPDPFTGQLQPIVSANYYGQIPFNQPSVTFSGGTDVQLPPLYGQPTGGGMVPFPPTTANYASNYFYVIANPLTDPNSENLTPTAQQTLATTYDPLVSPAPTPPAPPVNVIPPGYIPTGQTGPFTTLTASKTNTALPGPVPQIGKNSMLYYWICLRRPADPFAAPDPVLNPMIVVDSMRFPYIEGGGTVTTFDPNMNDDTIVRGTNVLYSTQRAQPYRGGHAVRLPLDKSTAATPAPLAISYGYSEQSIYPSTKKGTYGTFWLQSLPNPKGTSYPPGPAITTTVYHTLGAINDQSEPWDWFVFHDRDFTSLAELTLVPGCPPGLFTKQFVELPPMAPSTTLTSSTPPLTNFPISIAPPNPSATSGYPPAPNTALPTIGVNLAVQFQYANGSSPVQPHTYPYLQDQFFYSGYGGTSAPLPVANTVGGNAADGWFKMFDFFEIPSQMLGAIGPVALGTNFDWARQDLKPGLLNLNLIIDEEVFFSVLGRQSLTQTNATKGTNSDQFSQTLLSFAQIPTGSSAIPQVVTASNALGAANYSYPFWQYGVSSGIVANDLINYPAGSITGSTNAGANNSLKAAFAQFLFLRHGGTGFMFGAGAERPFHSFSYPDINYTMMRPAILPPASTTAPTLPYTSGTYTADPGVRNAYIYTATPSSYTSYGSTPMVAPTPGTVYSTAPTINVELPPAIPARRLFQIPDAYPGVAMMGPPASNASDAGDPFINVTLGTGALPNITTTNSNISPAVVYALNNGYPVLNWSGSNAVAPIVSSTPSTVSNPYLGSGGTAAAPNYKQHPYWRTEMLQRAMNLTTVRTHQYAVWVTIGFFEVLRQGDIGMISTSPALAFDTIGPEIGALNGKNVRYRGFYLVDRTKLIAFDPASPGLARSAVVYRQRIQ